MADKKILDLTAKTTPADTDAVIVQEAGGASGSTRYTLLSGLWTWAKTKADALYAAVNHAHTGVYDAAGDAVAAAAAERSDHEADFVHADIAMNTAARHTHDNLTALSQVAGTNTGDESTFTGPGTAGVVPDPVSSSGRFLGDAGSWATVTVDSAQIASGAVTSPKLGDGLQRRNIAISPFDAAGSAVVGDGVIGVPVPAELNGWNLIAALCVVATAGTTGTMDVQVRRRRAGTNADMLGTKITLNSGDHSASDGVVDTANDDLATGDLLYVDFDTVHTTPAKGPAVVLTFEKP